jgi:hypothetical protein
MIACSAWSESAISAASQIGAAIQKSKYPRVVREIPLEFRGTWDELNCGIREVRYRISARRMFNFEAGYTVRNVTLRSPTEIVVITRADPEVGGSTHGVWRFRLVEDGKALSGPSGKPPFITRCSSLDPLK